MHLAFSTKDILSDMVNMNKKTILCVKCDSILIKKNGKFRGIQRYKCVNCATQFQLNKKKDFSRARKKLWYEFCFQYATVDTLKGRYKKSEKWVRIKPTASYGS